MAADNTGPRASMANQCDRMGSRHRQTAEPRRQFLPEPRSDSSCAGSDKGLLRLGPVRLHQLFKTVYERNKLHVRNR